MIHRDIEKALHLLRVQVHRQDAAHARARKRRLATSLAVIGTRG